MVVEAVDQNNTQYQGLQLLFYRAALPLSSRTLTFVSGNNGRPGRREGVRRGYTPAPQIREFFAGPELADPGIADIAAWRPAVQVARSHLGAALFYGGAMRRPEAPRP